MAFVHQRLRALREATGESREQVAVATGRSLASIAHYEIGLRVPPTAVLETLCDHYGVRIDDLFDRAAS